MKPKRGWILALAGIALLGCVILKAAPAATSVKTAAGERLAAADARRVEGTGVRDVAENDRYVLSYDFEGISLSLRDKHSGAVWNSSVDAGIIREIRTSTLVREQMASLLTLKYVNNKESGFIKAVKDTSLMTEIDTLDTRVQENGNGIRIDMDFGALGFRIALEATLDESGLVVRIPEDGIEEYKSNGLLSIGVLPFFGAALPNEDGYLFYPDGCGAIHRFSDAASLPSTALKTYSFTVYGSSEVAVNPEGQMWNRSGEWKGIAYLPCFGMKKGDAGFLASIEAGETDADIIIQPSGAQVAMARIHTAFTLRRMFDPVKSRISAESSTSGTTSKIKRIDKEFIRQERTVRYSFLNGEASDYGGMAASYRSRLMARGMLRKSALVDRERLAVFDLFMATMQDDFPFDSFVRMTTFAQAEEMTDRLKESGIDAFALNLLGWSRKGYGETPQPFVAAPQLGGRRGLERLLKKSEQDQVPVLLHLDMVDRTAGFLKWGIGRQMVADGNGSPVADYWETRYLYNSSVALSRFAEERNRVPTTAAAGYSFAYLGNLIYHDYNRYQPTSRGETAENWRSMLQEGRKTGVVGAYGGNAYVLGDSDILFDIPAKSGGLLVTSEDVPFYQMVVHGSVVYAGPPCNLLGNRLQYLKLIEYGYAPYYRLTYGPSEALMFTGSGNLYSTQFDQCLERIVEDYAEQEPLAGVQSRTILRHGRLDKDLAVTTYDDGTRVIVNYGDAERSVEGVAVGAQDFVVLRGGRNG